MNLQTLALVYVVGAIITGGTYIAFREYQNGHTDKEDHGRGVIAGLFWPIVVPVTALCLVVALGAGLVSVLLCLPVWIYRARKRAGGDT